jgi:hypothetical protein
MLALISETDGLVTRYEHCWILPVGYSVEEAQKHLDEFCNASSIIQPERWQTVHLVKFVETRRYKGGILQEVLPLENNVQSPPAPLPEPPAVMAGNEDPDPVPGVPS